jgi:hypothetical protein
MKITVEIPENELREICRITGISKKGPAIRQLLDTALQLARRKELSEKFVSGEWGTELSGFEAARSSDKSAAQTRSESWRD